MLKPKRKWTKEEEDALHAGVEKHGVSNWKFILSDSHFSSSLANRSNVDLKDKWRNLSRAKDRDLLNNRETAKIPSGIVCYEVDSEPLARFHGDSADQENKTKTTNKVGSDAADQENKTRKTNQVSSEPLARFGGDAADQENKTRTTNKVGSKPLARFGGDAADQEDKTRTKNVTTYRRRKRRRKKIVKEEDHSDSQDRDSEEYYNPCKISRQQRGARCKTVNQAKKLTCEQVHSYLENLWLSFPEDKKSSCTHLDPLWYTFYSSGSNKQKVLKWIKKKDIFSRKYVFFPIVQWGHWSVLIFCHFGESLVSKLNTPCVLLLDSLAKADHSNQLEPNIRKFVLDIYSNSERTEDIGLLRKMPFLVPKVPQQRDSEECGFFVLYYIKLFVENAPESFSITNGYPYFMKKDWFSFEGLDSFRKTLDSSHM